MGSAAFSTNLAPHHQITETNGEFDYVQILNSIRQGGTGEIINLFHLRADAVQCCQELETEFLRCQPADHSDLVALQSVKLSIIHTIDNY